MKKTAIISSVIILIIFFIEGTVIYLNHGQNDCVKVFKNSKNESDKYELWYNSFTGDLVFQSRKQNPSISVRFLDYYGDPQVQNYKWINESTLIIKLKEIDLEVKIPASKILKKTEQITLPNPHHAARDSDR